MEDILAKTGMKKKDATILIKLAKRKHISLGRAFFCMHGNIMPGVELYYWQSFLPPFLRELSTL